MPTSTMKLAASLYFLTAPSASIAGLRSLTRFVSYKLDLLVVTLKDYINTKGVLIRARVKVCLMAFRKHQSS